VHAGELAFAPVSVEVPGLDGIPWFVLLMLVGGAHCNGILVEQNGGQFDGGSGGRVD